ncbi:phytase [Lentinus tigrinus ALCF2SS1-7]|uniref:phytase n=1 Tax=Lentinus tigrinus ALCF2SS1-7 TaxID=1328758 RepID=UPI001165D8D9|nr:phytase [Lentinus tigrinus ALCF2SS1-7]
MALLALITLTYLCYTYAAFVSPRIHYSRIDASSVPSIGISDDVQQSWSMYSPYFAAGTYEAPPDGCLVDQVNQIQRHGARFPTSGAATRIKAALSKLQSVTDSTDSLLEFVEDYTYDLGQDNLVPFGASQSYEAGRVAFERYSWILKGQEPFVRASSGPRVVDSASNWTAGFAAASAHRYNPAVSVILSEAGNDTLDDNMCPAAGDSDPETNAWLATFAPPMTARLNAGAVGANLTDTDTYNLLTLCPFDTVAKERPGDFCAVYEALDAGSAFMYSGDLDKYYGTGYGQPLGPVQGVGYINELLARLTGTAVQDQTQTNSTLDSDPATFPLNRTFYADFSHDNQMAAIFAAMGLFRQSTPLNATNPDPSRTWRNEKMLPFSGRMVVERLSCDGQTHVRVLVNDALMPLEFCGSGDGLCTLDAFVGSQSYARNNGNGDWEQCFE